MLFSRYVSLLKNYRYLAFFLSQILTNFSDGLTAVAIIYFAVTLKASPWELGIITFGITLSRGFLGPIGGVISDRMDKRQYLISIEVLRMVLMFVLYLLFAKQIAGIWYLMVFGILISTLFAISVPAAKSIIPKLVSTDDLQPANALIQTITWPAYFLGSGLLAIILPLGMERFIFLIVSIFFAISSILQLKLPKFPHEYAMKSKQRYWFLSDLVKGYYEMRSDKVMHARVWTYGIFTFFWRGCLQIIIPLAVLKHLDSPKWLFGTLMLVNGTAEFITNLYIGKMRLSRPLVFSFLCEPVLALGILAIVTGFIMPFPEIGLLLGSLLVGIAAAIIDIPLLTVIQTKVSENSVSKVVSYWFAIGSTGGALGSLALGFYFDAVPFVIGTLVLGIVSLFIGVGMLLWSMAASRGVK